MPEADTLEELPTQEATDSDYKRSHKAPIVDPSDREAIKALSIAGLTDIAILERFPHVKAATLRKWRERDPIWSAAFAATRMRQLPIVTNPDKDLSPASQKVSERAGALVSSASGAVLADLHSRTALKLAQASAAALGAFAEAPSEIKDWQDAKTAYSIQRLACGIDKEGTQVSLNLAMFQQGNSEQDVGWESDDSQGESYSGQE